MIKIDHCEDMTIMLCIHLKSDPNYIKQNQLSHSYFIDWYLLYYFLLYTYFYLILLASF